MRVWMRAGLGLAIAALLLCIWALAGGQASAAFAPEPSSKEKERVIAEVLPDKPTIPPAFSIPAEPLGFSAPGAIYLGQRNALASLDFLDEDRLLFTFRVPGLIHREPGERGDERQIRAVVLALPSGAIEAEALWTVHDHSRYLWMLKDGHFLLRDQDGLQLGDTTLNLKPFLHFPGPVLWLEMDPQQQYLVTNSREPVSAAHRPGDVASAANHPGGKDPSAGTPDTASANVAVDGQTPVAKPDMVLRILRRDSGRVMLVSRVGVAVHLPLNSDGYIESLRGNGEKWTLNLNYFSGGSRILGQVNSTCLPVNEFVSDREVLVTACDSSGGHRLVALDTDGRHLWDVLVSGSGVWPLVVKSLDGLRLARETLSLKHPGVPFAPLDGDDIKGQLVKVLDAADGKVALAAPAIPALDAGGNVAISPSGRRVAVINSGAIQVFELPPPAPLPEAAGSQAGH